MDRRLIAFTCEGATLLGTLDAASGETGLLIVSGGSELRCGAHRGMALLAARLAAGGVPVFRYDRRGVGDSEGENRGWAAGGADLRAALAAFRLAMPRLGRVVALGNCDAATLLALEGRQAGIDTVVLTNPWTIEQPDALPPAAAIRRRYAERLRQPRVWWRLLRGGVDLSKLAAGLGKLARSPRGPQPLAGRMAAALHEWGADATVVLAWEDATAIAFQAAVPGVAVMRVDSASHSFARQEDGAALEQIVREVLQA